LKKVTILFDLDGTLIDSTEAIVESFFVAFDKNGIQKPTPKEIISLIGHPLDFMFLHLGIKKEQINTILADYKVHYRAVSKPKTKLLENAKEAIILASKFAKLGVVTTKTGEYSKELLSYFGVLDYFEIVIGREDVINPKPHPEPILKAIHEMNAIKDYSVMIGDTCLDVISAKDAEIHSIAVTTGYATKQELERCSNYIANNSLEAVHFVIKLFNLEQ